MSARILPGASEDLRAVVRYYRAIPPPHVGRQLADRVMREFKECLPTVAAMPLSRPEHPDIPGVR